MVELKNKEIINEIFYNLSECDHYSSKTGSGPGYKKCI